MSGTSLLTAAYFNNKSDSDDFLRNRRRRDTAYIIAGTSFASSVLTQILLPPDPEDMFTGKAMLRIPKLPKYTTYCAGLTALSAGASIYYDSIVKDARSKVYDAKDKAGENFYLKKILIEIFL